MKKILFLLVIMLLSLGVVRAQNEGVNYRKIGYEEALKQCKSDKKAKYVLINFTATWCGPCKMMDRNVTSKKECGDYFNKEFVSIKMDVDSEEGKALAKKYKIQPIPAFVLVDENGEEINRLIGSRATPAEFLNEVKELFDPTLKLSYLEEQYKKEGTMESAMTYLKAIKKKGMDGDNVVCEIYKKQSKKEVYDKEFFKLLFDEMISYENAIDVYQDMMFNTADCTSLIGEERFVVLMDNILVDYFLKVITGEIVSETEKVLEAVKSYNLLVKTNESKKVCAMLAFYFAKGDLNGYLDYYSKNIYSALNTQNYNPAYTESLLYVLKDATPQQKQIGIDALNEVKVRGRCYIDNQLNTMNESKKNLNK